MKGTNFRQQYRSMNDIAMRHSGGYCGILDSTGFITPLKIVNIKGNMDLPILHVCKEKGEEFTVDMNEPTLLLERPELGMFNIVEQSFNTQVAVWPETLPYRQLKRSLVPEMFIPNLLGSSIVKVFTAEDLLDYKHGTFSMFEAASYFFNKIYPSFKDILTEIRGGTVLSGAFSPKFALGIHAKFGIVLYYKANIVGYINNDSPILCTSFLYLQEQLEETCYDYE